MSANKIGDKMYIATYGLVCIDCAMVIANGDTSGIEDLPAWEARVTKQNPTENGRYDIVMSCSENCDGEFSTARCNYCGTTDDGERHPVAFMTSGPIAH
jgi:hypothetical protein